MNIIQSLYLSTRIIQVLDEQSITLWARKITFPRRYTPITFKFSRIYQKSRITHISFAIIMALVFIFTIIVLGQKKNFHVHRRISENKFFPFTWTDSLIVLLQFKLLYIIIQFFFFFFWNMHSLEFEIDYWLRIFLHFI